MKTSVEQDEIEADDMLPEYDFSGMQGVRGKYHQHLRAGHSVRIHGANGEVSVQHFKPADGTILLDPDVRRYFPDSETVNRTLRSLIELLPRDPKVSAA